jgi:23S rRNA pseudouridine1911/1915/1917 synthase
VYQDHLLVAVAKPRGLPTLPGGGFLETTLLAQVRARFPEASPMHRLGRETSGIVLFSRTPAAGARIQAAWREHRIVKAYRALASGVAREDSLVITAPIGPVAHPWLGTLFAASADGKPARSEARVLERRADATLFEVLIETGRPHQIRIHLAFAGHPLVGDPLYAPGGLPRPDLPALPGDGGYFLHAERLVFPHPDTGALVELRDPPPAELRTRS